MNNILRDITSNQHSLELVLYQIPVSARLILNRITGNDLPLTGEAVLDLIISSSKFGEVASLSQPLSQAKRLDR
jgi:hypothetical protein